MSTTISHTSHCMFPLLLMQLGQCVILQLPFLLTIASNILLCSYAQHHGQVAGYDDIYHV